MQLTVKATLNLTLLPSLREIGECHVILNGVWQWLKHESMNSPQPLLCWATFKSSTIFSRNPKVRRRKIHMILVTRWEQTNTRDWKIKLTIHCQNLCGSTVSNISFATGPWLSWIRSAWRHDISYLESSSPARILAMKYTSRRENKGCDWSPDTNHNRSSE